MKEIYKNIDVNKLKTIVENSDSFIDVINKMGLDNKNINIKRNIERIIKKNRIPTNHFSTVIRVQNAKNNYTKEKLQELTQKSKTFKEILESLGLLPFYTNYNTLKRHLKKFNIDYSHISNDKKYGNALWDKEYLKQIVKDSKTQKEVLEKLGIRAAGGNFKTLRKYIERYKIDTSHFKKSFDEINLISIKKIIPLSDILIENSKYDRGHLKKRLFDTELKQRKCELCGQDEWWNGKKMSLILDHKNGIYNDNRIENLQIVCPNCNATLDTHCRKK